MTTHRAFRRTSVLGQDVGKGLIEVLGLPPGVVSINIQCAVNELVQVDVRLIADNAGGIVDLFRRYNLIDVDPLPAVADSIAFDKWMSERKEAAHRAFVEHYEELANLDRRIAHYTAFPRFDPVKDSPCIRAI